MGRIIGFAMTVVIGAVAWFTVGQDTLDRINRAKGGGVVPAKKLTPVVAKLKKAAGVEARLVSLTLRDDSVEMVAALRGRARGYRWRGGEEKLETFDVGGAGERGKISSKPFPMSKLDPRAPERITRAIAEAEGGKFSLSIADLERADTGKIVWIMRGMIGERGIAYFAPANGSRIKPYNPSDPELSKAARLVKCTSRANNDAKKVQRCLDRFPP